MEKSGIIRPLSSLISQNRIRTISSCTSLKLVRSLEINYDNEFKKKKNVTEHGQKVLHGKQKQVLPLNNHRLKNK